VFVDKEECALAGEQDDRYVKGIIKGKSVFESRVEIGMPRITNHFN
jgi:hypothetical protein